MGDVNHLVIGLNILDTAAARNSLVQHAAGGLDIMGNDYTTFLDLDAFCTHITTGVIKHSVTILVDGLPEVSIGTVNFYTGLLSLKYAGTRSVDNTTVTVLKRKALGMATLVGLGGTAAYVPLPMQRSSSEPIESQLFDSQSAPLMHSAPSASGAGAGKTH